MPWGTRWLAYTCGHTSRRAGTAPRPDSAQERKVESERERDRLQLGGWWRLSGDLLGWLRGG